MADQKKIDEVAKVLGVDAASAKRILDIQERLQGGVLREDKLIEGCLVKFKELRDKTKALEEEYRVVGEVLESLMDSMTDKADLCDDLTNSLDELQETLEKLQLSRREKK